LKKILSAIICFFIITKAFSQNRYSIDVNANIDRKASIGYILADAINTRKEDRIKLKEKRIDAKISDKTRKHAYRIQTRKTKKRMRELEKKAYYFNSGKLPVLVKINKILKNG